MRAIRDSLAIAVVIGSLGLTARAAAQASATITMTADRTELAVGEQLRMQVRADVTNGSADDLNLPDLSGFHIVSRRVARPMQFSFGFGSQRQMVQSSVVYDLVLQATEAGTFTLPPATLNLAGRTFQSEPLTIVVKGGLTGGATPPRPAEPPAGPLEGANFDQDAFVRTVLDEESVFVGQQLTVTVYLYVRGNLRSAPQVTRAPTTDGFWVHDLLPVQRSLNAQHQVVNGVPFDVYVLKRFAAFPLRSGTLTVGAPTVSLQTGSVFDLFNRAGGGSLRRDGVAVQVEAKPLPSNPGSGGTVAVGRWEIEATLDRSQVATGDAVTLRAQIEGVGNPQDLSLPTPRVDGLRLLAPEIDEAIRAPSDLVQGSRSWRWLIIPQRPGSYRIGPLRLVTFDPTAKQYRTIQTATLRLEAAGAAQADGTEPPRDPSHDADDPDRGPLLSPIRRTSELLRHRVPLSRNPGFVAALCAPPGVFAFVLAAAALRRRRRRRSTHGVRHTTREARRRLNAAQHRAAAGEVDLFYAEARKLLVDTVEARLEAPIGGLTYPELRRYLASKGMPASVAENLVDELEGTEFARFSAEGASDREVERCVARISALLDALDGFQPTEEASP